MIMHFLIMVCTVTVDMQSWKHDMVDHNQLGCGSDAQSPGAIRSATCGKTLHANDLCAAVSHSKQKVTNLAVQITSATDKPLQKCETWASPLSPLCHSTTVGRDRRLSVSFAVVCVEAGSGVDARPFAGYACHHAFCVGPLVDLQPGADRGCKYKCAADCIHRIAWPSSTSVQGA